MELRDLINGAQEAMEQGDFRLAIAAGNHALVGYDSCLAAHRMLGEAYLERGDQEAAVTHFERALAVDPLNVVARLGLGVAAEETRRYEEAYAHYLHAWEINPALDQVRDELVRLRGLLNVEDRLHPTRAGLAGIHARCGQFSRAASEWRAVLSVEPESRRARTSLAELLWRQGDDAGAAAAAREALRGNPENGRALAILADVEKRRGGANAQDFTQRFSSVDPTGEVLDYLRHWRSDTDLDTLIPDSALIDDFDFESNRSRQTGGLSRKSITGSLAASQMAAPDLWDTLVKDLTSEVAEKPAPTLATGVEPFSWADGPPPDDAMATAEPPADDSDIFPALAEAETEVETPVEPVAVPESNDEPVASVAPEPVAEASNAGQDPLSIAELNLADAIPPAVDADLDDLDLDLVPFSMDQLTGTVAPSSEVNESTLDAMFGAAEPAQPAEPVEASAPPVEAVAPLAAAEAIPDLEPYDDPFVSADGRIDLTAGWDSLDQALADATPSANGNGGFDDLMAEFDVDGIIPFDATTESPDEDAWSPFGDGDFDVPAAETPVVDELDQPGIDLSVPDATGEALDIADLEAFDVTAFVEPDAEPAVESSPEPALGKDIVAGIPLPEPSGYTELLRNIDEESLPEHAAHEHIDPFANPDATGDPLAFDELIEVTSTDGTGPLEERTGETDLAAELDFMATDLVAAMPALDAIEPDLDLEGIEPFDSDELESAFGFAEESAEAAEAPLAVEAPVELPVMAELGDVAPFAFDEGESEDADGAPVDFSEMDGEPDVLFMAQEVEPEPIAIAEAAPATAGIGEAAGGPEPVALDTVDAEPIAFDAEVAEPEADDDADEALAAVAGDATEAEIDDQVAEEVAAEAPRTGDEGGARVSGVAWPHFMSQTSDLIDRATDGEGLFARIAAQKDALVEMGVVTRGRRLATYRPVVMAPAVREEEPAAAVAVLEAPAAADDAPADADDQIRSELMRMRVRLIEDESSAAGIAKALESALAEGLQTPLAMRVLGEAYLKLGMVERAAAQFRAAMLARRRDA